MVLSVILSFCKHGHKPRLHKLQNPDSIPSFESEYNLQYLGILGNTFHVKDIDRAVLLGKSYDPNRVVVDAEKILELDPGWGSSAFGVCLLQVADGQIQVLLADEFERPRYEDITTKLMDIIQGSTNGSLTKKS